MARISKLGFDTLASRVSIYALGFIASVLIARALGPEGRGRYLLPVTVVAVTSVLANLGTTQAQTRLWSRGAGSRDDFVTGSLYLTIFLSIAAAAILWLVGQIAPASFLARIPRSDLLLAGMVIPFLMHQGRTSNFLIMNDRLRTTNQARFVGAFAQTVGVTILFLTGRLSVRGVLIFFVVSIALPSLIMAFHAHRLARIRRTPPWKLIYRHLRLGVVLGPTSIFQYFNHRIDIFLVANYEGVTGVGLYATAVTFSELLLLVTDAVVVAVMGRQVNVPDSEALELTYRAVRMNLALGILVGLGLGLVAPLIIPILYGEEFAPAVRVVWMLVPSIICLAAWRSGTTALLRFARAYTPTVIAMIALVLNVVANMLLIPRFGILGAGMASLISYFVGAFLVHRALLRPNRLSVAVMVPGRQELREILDLLSSLRSAQDELLVLEDDPTQGPK